MIVLSSIRMHVLTRYMILCALQIIGLNRVPSAGDPLIHAESDDQAREMAETRLRYTKQRSGSMASAAILATAAGFVGGAFDARYMGVH